jgi:hypothetical protein
MHGTKTAFEIWRQSAAVDLQLRIKQENNIIIRNFILFYIMFFSYVL